MGYRFTRQQYYLFFIVADRDRDSHISMKELHFVLRDYGYTGYDNDISFMFYSTDLNSDDFISLDEYWVCMGQKPSKKYVIYCIQSIFSRHDRNKDGKVNREQFNLADKDLRKGLTTDEYSRLMSLIKEEWKDEFKYLEFLKLIEAKWDRRTQIDIFWRKADRDRDGFLTLYELSVVLTAEGYSQKDIERKFKEMDKSGDGKISYEEYLMAMGEVPEHVHRGALLRKVFHKFDTDHSGTIDALELREACKEFGKFFSDAQMQQIMENADKDRSGELEYEEFVESIEEIMSAQDAYEKFFTDADHDNNGNLTVDELVQALRNGGYKGSDAQIKRMFNATDLSGDAKITMDEYLIAMGRAPRGAHRTAFMRKVFQEFDSNKDGKIDKKDMKIIFKEMGRTMTDKEMSQIIAMIDKDKSGALDYEEFISMWDKANKENSKRDR